MKANPTLSEDQREAVEADFGMVSGKVEIRVRRAMRDYTLAHLRLPAWGERSAPVFLELENVAQAKEALKQRSAERELRR